MNLQMLFRAALRSLLQHKVRSLLTTLGIIIGVVSIICVMSIGQGAKQKVNAEIAKLGENFIIALSASQKRLSQRGMPPRPIFTPGDMRAIRAEIDDISQVSAGMQVNTQVTYNGQVWNPIIAGVEENYLDIRSWALTAGSFFTKQDVISSNKLAVLGKTVYQELFSNDENPVGKTIRIKKIPFKIIGVLEEKGKRPDGFDQDDVVFTPISTLLRRVVGSKRVRYFALIASAKSKDRMRNAEEQLRSLIKQRHRIHDDQEENFTIFTQDDISQASNAASRILNLLLLIIASISLIVGGIGIMNIMLVTVTERTNEIGIRMALGATTSNILTQFLLEAITICFMGGAIGALLGIAASNAIGIALGWPIFISKISIAISLGSSILIGLFFGYYPAYKASMLDPVQALVEQ